MQLYNAKRTSEGLRITKFNSELEVEETNGKPASYITSKDGCDCPAGHRDTCRHRQMLPALEYRADTPWFLDYDGERWYYYHSETGELLDRPPQRPAWRRF